MSQRNMELVRWMIDAANRRDWEGAFRDVSADFMWDNSRAVGPDNRGLWTAPEARDFYETTSAYWESSRIEIDELIPVRDSVVVPHTIFLRGRDGVEVHVRTTWLFTIRDGKIDRVRLYQEKAEALEAAEG